MNPNFLNHFGIKGMRWGVRRSRGGTPPSLRKPIVNREDNSSEDHKQAKKLKKKRLNELSNAELSELNKRLQLEKQYKDLTKNEVARGQKIVDSVMNEIAKEGVKSAFKFAAKQGINVVKKVGK